MIIDLDITFGVVELRIRKIVRIFPVHPTEELIDNIFIDICITKRLLLISAGYLRAKIARL